MTTTDQGCWVTQNKASQRKPGNQVLTRAGCIDPRAVCSGTQPAQPAPPGRHRSSQARHAQPPPSYRDHSRPKPVESFFNAFYCNRTSHSGREQHSPDDPGICAAPNTKHAFTAQYATACEQDVISLHEAAGCTDPSSPTQSLVHSKDTVEPNPLPADAPLDESGCLLLDG